MTVHPFRIRTGTPDDQAAAYHVCVKTGDHGGDGEPFYRDDPAALGRIFVGPYLAFEPELSLILEDDQGVCGYAFGALDSRRFYLRYELEWRPRLCSEFPSPTGDPATWSRVQTVHSWYHQPNYFCPEPYSLYPSHMHIDLLSRARGSGNGRAMMEIVMERLRQRGSPGAHLGVSLRNLPAQAFYRALGFHDLIRTSDKNASDENVGSENDGTVYMGKRFDS